MADLLASGSWEPGDSALTTWMAAAGRGDLTLADVANAVPVLFSAGSGPARLMLGNLMQILTESPGLVAQLREFPELSQSAAEECARLDTPIQMVSRAALRDTEICDVQVRKGDIVHVLIGSANRDPLHFHHPDQADFRRTGTGALSYGQGIHRCLGSAMATMQVASLLPVLVRALPPWRFAEPPVRYPGTAFRGFLTMLVTTGSA
jgi:cytochrome P450